MRTAEDNAQVTELENRTFANWLLAVGEGKLEAVDGEEDVIYCPQSMLLRDQTEWGLIEVVYPGIGDESSGREYLKNRAILAARNDDVAKINEAVLESALGQIFDYFNADTIQDEEGADAILLEYLNSLEVSG